jgi:hypothetical protein
MVDSTGLCTSVHSGSIVEAKMTSKSLVADRTQREVKSSIRVETSPTMFELSANKSTPSAQCLRERVIVGNVEKQALYQLTLQARRHVRSQRQHSPMAHMKGSKSSSCVGV